MRYTIVLIALVLCGPGLKAQDTLFYTNGHKIAGHVEEVGVELVRYRTNSGTSSVLIVAEKRDLLRVKLEGGQEFVFENVSTDVPASAQFMARKQVISLDVIAPALNHVTIGYERVIGVRTSFVAKAGYIGLWQRDRYYDERMDQGWLVKLGPKFILPPATKRYPSARKRHPLAGWYLKPELMFSYWTTISDRYYYDPVYNYGYSERNRAYYSSAALNLVVGRQVLLGERWTFDLFGGLGYGVQWRNGSSTFNSYYYNQEEYSYSHAFFGSRSPLTGSGGMVFGYVF